MVVFSAHGVAPSVHANAAKRGLRTIDATCPLVTKVHVEARKFAAEGYTIVLVGHEGHEEVEGTTGEAPEQTVLVQTEADVDELEVEDPDRIAYITQTTLSVDETSSIIARLKEKFPNAVGPKTDDICYATTNRQQAVKAAGRGVRSRPRHRLDQLIELEPAGRGRARARRRLLPDRQPPPGRRGLARGRRDRRHHLGRQRPRGAGRAAGHLLPGARRRRRLRAEDRRRGRPLHAPRRDPQGARRLRRLAPSRRGFAEPRRSGNRGGELNRVDEEAGGGLQARGCALGALVGGQLLEPRERDLDRASRPRRRRGSRSLPHRQSRRRRPPASYSRSRSAIGIDCWARAPRSSHPGRSPESGA